METSEPSGTLYAFPAGLEGSDWSSQTLLTDVAGLTQWQREAGLFESASWLLTACQWALDFVQSINDSTLGRLAETVRTAITHARREIN